MPEAESSPTPAAGTELPDPGLPAPETIPDVETAF